MIACGPPTPDAASLWGYDEDADGAGWEAKLTISPGREYYELSTPTRPGSSMGQTIARGSHPAAALVALKSIGDLGWNLVSTYKR
jgi:hypothetical protein